MGDAVQFGLVRTVVFSPDDLTLVYMFRPFIGAVFGLVVYFADLSSTSKDLGSIGWL